MDLSDIPFNVPVIIQSVYTQKNLQNTIGSKKARCLTNNRDTFEHVILHHVRDDEVAIQSQHNGRFLHVRTSGECVFGPSDSWDWELFTIEINSECSLFFVSCHTGKVLQCAGQGVVQCANKHRDRWEAWRIIGPSINATMNQTQRVLDSRYCLANTDRQNFVMDLVKHGKTPDEIEQIVTRLFDGPAARTSTPAVYALGATE
uniref:Uncharacterized protein n=1 Tax=Peronospora matthiolae TaxID=2874970 RepID=A0AAV1URI4_9STRA